MSFLTDLLGLFFPDLCCACKGRLVTGESYVCLDCQSKLPRTGFYKERDNQLEQLFAGRFPFVRIAAFAHFVKGGTLQPLIHSLKYNNNPKLGVFMGQLSGREMSGSSFLEDIDFLIPVPLHPKRQKERGYNQAEEIAKGISVETGIPLCSDVLIRTINNTSQTKHSRFERWSNTDGIFSIVSPEILDNKHILLIDDVVTTGSTLESCVKTILACCDNVKVSIYCIGMAID